MSCTHTHVIDVKSIGAKSANRHILDAFEQRMSRTSNTTTSAKAAIAASHYHHIRQKGSDTEYRVCSRHTFNPHTTTRYARRNDAAGDTLALADRISLHLVVSAFLCNMAHTTASAAAKPGHKHVQDTVGRWCLVVDVSTRYGTSCGIQTQGI